MQGDAGRVIKLCREKQHLTKRRLSEMSQVPETTLASYESGKCEPPYEKFERIMSALGYTIFFQKRGKK